MLITRTIGKIFRGNATPFQLMLASVLASMLGFMPGLAQAPGLILVLLLLLIIFNANLALAALVGVAAKILSLLLMPVSFAAGRLLLDGPLQGLFKKMINAPVLALFGWEYYATTGGLAMGLIVGAVAGTGVIKLVTAFRKKMAELETGSEKFQHFAAKKWVKLLTFIFVGGGHGNKSYEEILARKVGNPIRPLGVIFAVLLVVLLLILQMFLTGPIVTMALQQGLERANGATVDLESAELDLKQNRLTLTSLAMADPNALDTDLFRAAKLEGNVSGLNLLRKRLQLDRVVMADASHGEKRKSPGHLVGKPPRPTEDKTPLPNAKTIEDFIRNAKVWKERLAQFRRWLEKISGPEAEKSGRPGEKEETLPERLAREIRDQGYARVRANHLIEGAPTFTISELLAHKVRLAQLPGETLDITARNLSTHPHLLGQAPQVAIKSSAHTLGLETRLGEFDATNRTENALDFFYRGLPTERVAKNLNVGGKTPIQGGTIDIAARGAFSTLGGIYVNMPLQITLHDCTLSVAGAQSTKVDQFALSIGLRGPLDNPRLVIDEKNLAAALAKAGLAKAAEELKGRAQEKIGEKLGKGLLDGVLGGEKKDQK